MSISELRPNVAGRTGPCLKTLIFARRWVKSLTFEAGDFCHTSIQMAGFAQITRSAHKSGSLHKKLLARIIHEKSPTVIRSLL
jgi:hypothetical protein